MIQTGLLAPEVNGLAILKAARIINNVAGKMVIDEMAYGATSCGFN